MAKRRRGMVMRFGGRATSLILLTLGAGVGLRAQPAWPPPYREPQVRVVETAAPDDLPWTLEALLMRDENFKKATVNGQYRMLMLQFDDPGSQKKYGDFQDVGLSPGPPGMHMPAALPQGPLPGYWVYAAPSWYVWHALTAAPAAKRAWSPEQVTGPPNTPFTGTLYPAAWTSRTPGGAQAWLLLEFEHFMQPSRLQIYESLHPGAINRITMMALDGREVEVWSGRDPTRSIKRDAALFELTLHWPPDMSFFDPNPAPRTIFATNRVKLYLNPAAVEGWNEIDAVALVDASNLPQWATAAVASSSYADRDQPVAPPLPAGLVGGWPAPPPDTTWLLPNITVVVPAPGAPTPRAATPPQTH